jgi:predicted phosphoribosyltransferase
MWYEDFSQTTDEDVQQLLKLAQEERPNQRSNV